MIKLVPNSHPLALRLGKYISCNQRELDPEDVGSESTVFNQTIVWLTIAHRRESCKYKVEAQQLQK